MSSLREKLHKVTDMQSPINGPGIKHLEELLTAIVERIEPEPHKLRVYKEDPPQCPKCKYGDFRVYGGDGVYASCCRCGYSGSLAEFIPAPQIMWVTGSGN